MTPRDQRRLYGQIRQGMWYWAQRMILGLPPAECQPPNRSAEVHRIYQRRADRRRYARARAAGKSSYEASRQDRVRHIQDCRAYRERWGGCPKVGSRAWVEREIARDLAGVTDFRRAA
jgi:hypothetical protein